jgi:hypothetical protein
MESDAVKLAAGCEDTKMIYLLSIVAIVVGTVLFTLGLMWVLDWLKERYHLGGRWFLRSNVDNEWYW